MREPLPGGLSVYKVSRQSGDFFAGEAGQKMSLCHAVVHGVIFVHAVICGDMAVQHAVSGDGRRGKLGKPGNAGGISYVGAAAQWCTDDELDVRWYCCDAPGRAAGMRSNMGAQIDALRLGFSHLEASYVDPDEDMVERLDDAARARRVLHLLHAIGPTHTATLLAVYGGEVPPAGVRERWGLRAPVVLLLDPLASKHTKGNRAVELDRAAERRLGEAHHAYATARAARSARTR